MGSVTGERVNARFLDASEKPNQILLPVRGYENEPMLPLEKAVQSIYELLNDLDMMMDTTEWNPK